MEEKERLLIAKERNHKEIRRLQSFVELVSKKDEHFQSKGSWMTKNDKSTDIMKETIRDEQWTPPKKRMENVEGYHTAYHSRKQIEDG